MVDQQIGATRSGGRVVGVGAGAVGAATTLAMIQRGSGR